MKKERVLYATKIGCPDYMEDILTTKEERFKDAKLWATNNGYDRFRIAEIDLTEKPNFIKTINHK